MICLVNFLKKSFSNIFVELVKSIPGTICGRNSERMPVEVPVKTPCYDFVKNS